MINSLKLLNCLINNNINFFCGVPDSILKFLTQEVVKNKKVKNITTPNEGSSIALAAGYYLSKKKCILNGAIKTRTKTEIQKKEINLKNNKKIFLEYNVISTTTGKIN